MHSVVKSKGIGGSGYLNHNQPVSFNNIRPKQELDAKSSFRAHQISNNPRLPWKDHDDTMRNSWNRSAEGRMDRSTDPSRDLIDQFRVEKIETELGSIIDKVNSVLLNTKRTNRVIMSDYSDSKSDRSLKGPFKSDARQSHHYQEQQTYIGSEFDEQRGDNPNAALASFMSFSDLPYSGGDKCQDDGDPTTPRHEELMSPKARHSNSRISHDHRTEQNSYAATISMREVPSNQATARTATLGMSQFTSQAILEQPKLLSHRELNLQSHFHHKPSTYRAKPQHFQASEKNKENWFQGRQINPQPQATDLSSTLVYPPNIQYRKDFKASPKAVREPFVARHQAPQEAPEVQVAAAVPQKHEVPVPQTPQTSLQPVSSRQGVQPYILKSCSTRSISPPTDLNTSREQEGPEQEHRGLQKSENCSQRDTPQPRSVASHRTDYNHLYADSVATSLPDPAVLELRQEEQLVRLRFLCNRRFTSLAALIQLVEDSVLLSSSHWAQGVPNLSKPLETVARSIRMVKRTIESDKSDDLSVEGADDQITEALSTVVQNSVKVVYKQLKAHLEIKRSYSQGSSGGPTPATATQRSGSAWDYSKISVSNTVTVANQPYEGREFQRNSYQGAQEHQTHLEREFRYQEAHKTDEDMVILDAKVKGVSNTSSQDTIPTLLFSKLAAKPEAQGSHQSMRPSVQQPYQDRGSSRPLQPYARSRSTSEDPEEMQYQAKHKFAEKRVAKPSKDLKHKFMASATLFASRFMSFRVCSITKYRQQPILGFEDGAIVVLSTENKSGDAIEMEKCFRHSTETITCLQVFDMAELNNSSSRSDVLVAAAGIQDPTLFCINLQSYSVVKQLKGGHSQVITGIQSIEGTYFATCSLDKTLKMWDFGCSGSSGCISTLYPHDSPIICSAYSNDLQLLATGDLNGTIVLTAIHMEQGRFKSWSNYALIRGSGPILELAFDNYRRVLAFENSRIRVYDCRGTLFKEIQTRLFVASARFLPDGKLLVVEISGKPWILDYDRILRASEYSSGPIELGDKTANHFDQVELATQMVSQRLTGCRPRAQVTANSSKLAIFSTDGRATSLLVHNASSACSPTNN